MTRRSLGRELVERAAALHGSLPAGVSASARLHLLDALGVGAAGAVLGPLNDLPGAATAHGGGRCSVLGSTDSTTAPVAALLNGSLIHSLEFDDTHVASVMHGSSVLAPAALAVAQEVAAAGSDLLSAYALGWEVLIRIGLASPGTLQSRGFQTTSAAGPFVAALVSGLLHGDPVDLIVEAVGIAGSQPGGTFAFLADGDTVKAGQPGWAAHSGLWAAELARGGMTGPASVFEGPLGFFALYAGDPDAPDRLRAELADLGTRWHLPDAAYKLIPCCHFIHPFVEALGEVLDGGVAPEEIVGIHCYVPRGAAPIIAEPWAVRQQPPTPHDARWSLPYVLAARALDGEVALALFQTPVGGERLELSLRITHEIWDDCSFPAVFPARLTVKTHTGRTVDASVDDVIGGTGRPVAPEAVVQKARDNLAAGGLAPDAIEELVSELLERDSPDVALIGVLLGQEPVGSNAR